MKTANIEVQAEKDWMLPTKKHPSDAAFDLQCVEDFTILTNQIIAVSTGIKISIPHGFAGFIMSRSGLATSGITVANGVGLIDSGYLGEIKVILHNSRRVQTFEAGSRIAQILFIELPTVNFDIVPQLTVTTLRGENGLGSTGIG